MKKSLIAFHVVIIAVLIFAFWRVSKTQSHLIVLCARGSAPVHTLQDAESPIFEVLPEGTKVGWDGTKSGSWIFVSFEKDYGWVRLLDFDYCNRPTKTPVRWYG